MDYKTRKIISPPNLNSGNTLFGGQLLKWIDEEVSIFAMCQLGTNRVLTKFMSEIDFRQPAYLGEIVEIGTEVVSFGTTSITLRCQVRVKGKNKVVITIDKIVFVHIDEQGRPKPHGKSRVIE